MDEAHDFCKGMSKRSGKLLFCTENGAAQLRSPFAIQEEPLDALDG